jgi:hypothetical protein
VDGIWAASTRPQYAGRGIESLLLNEAHRNQKLLDGYVKQFIFVYWTVLDETYIPVHGYRE